MRKTKNLTTRLSNKVQAKLVFFKQNSFSIKNHILSEEIQKRISLELKILIEPIYELIYLLNFSLFILPKKMYFENRLQIPDMIQLIVLKQNWTGDLNRNMKFQKWWIK